MNSSCEKQEEFPLKKDSEGVVTSMPYQWKTSLSHDGSLIQSFLKLDVIYNDHVLMASQNEAGSRLSMLSVNTGKVLWHWNDLYELDNPFDIYRLYQYNEHMAFQQGKSFYRINLSDGSTLQKERREYQASSMTGIGSLYFVAGDYVLNTENYYEGKIYVGDITTSEDQLLYSPSYSRQHVDGNNTIGVLGSTVPFKDDSGNILLTYNYTDPQPEWKGSTYAGLYNYSKKSSIYDKKTLTSNIPFYGSGPAVIYEDKAYYSPGKSIICIDVYTGEQLWKRDFPEGFTFSRYIIAEDKLLANCEDTYLYALDPDTGQQLWKEKSSGTSSPMSYLNGIVYFVGGGDGLLHAVEVETGKHLWRISSPDLKANSGAWFKTEVIAISPENEGKKGKVLTSSYLSAFCYEAAR